MSDFTLTSSECLPLTRKLAEEFQQMPASPTERTLDPKRLRHLEAKARKGLLVTFHWSKVKYKGKWLRMNGQHSSTMLCNLNGEFPDRLFAHVDSFEVEDPAGLASLFRQYDDRKSGRTPLDVSGAFQGLIDVLNDVPRPSAKLAVEGVNWWRGRVEGLPVSQGDDAYELMSQPEHYTFIQWIGKLFTIKTPELRKAPVVAVMYATFEKNEAEARRFWESVAKGGDEYTDGDPAAVLSSWYVKAKDKDQRKPPKPAEYYQAGVFAWNAYRGEKTISSIRADAKKGWLEPIA